MSDKQKAKQFHFTVPSDDTDVLKWIEEQNKLTISIRLVIKDAIKKYGFGDVFSVPVSNPGVTAGRPQAAPVRHETVQPDYSKMQIDMGEKPVSNPVRPMVQPTPAGSGNLSDALSSML